MKALVTGGAGFIGSNLADALLAGGHHVAVLDDLSTGRRTNLDSALAAGARLHEADVRDAEAVREIVAEERPRALFHLAAQIDVRRSVAETAFDARVNVEGTVNVLEAARRAGVERVVHASTGGAIYGEADVLPTPETAAIRPLSPYGQSKYAAEGYCEVYARLHGLSAVSLRFGNVYGPRQDPLGEAGVVAIFCRNLVDGVPPRIFGDGGQTRDYVFVGDVVRAFLTAASTGVEGAINVACGVETSVLELVDALRGLADAPDLEHRHDPPRHGEVRRSCLDPRRATALLGWEATTGLREGLARTLETMRGPAGVAGP